MNGQFFCETSDECVPCSGVVKLRAEIGAREAALVCAHERWVEQDAEIERLTTENERLRKLCPSMVEFDTNEALHPESTITVAVGYLHTLLEKDAEIAELQADLKETAAVRDDACSLIADTNNALAICRAENAALAKLVSELAELPNDARENWLGLADLKRRAAALRAGQQKG